MSIQKRKNQVMEVEREATNFGEQKAVPMISINHIFKRYRLGQIGGTTLRDELQRFSAKLHNREDPTKRIGSTEHHSNEIFQALNDVSFEVASGERVGIIGRNGAGKSTLLKLISRVTAPTSGWIGLNGRVASMLEVGTGFHHELTGRENIYMNGAILGMTKKEIDEKLESIIDFSECRQFIDTPVKRYSSGMYVKLAFSVAAHLDSEILIMDEVLAVGDVAFQKKCLSKMEEVSQNNGRTILYVSHNMGTIRELCNRCVVLDHGTVIFNGGVQEAIDIYTQTSFSKSATMNDVSSVRRRGRNGQRIRIMQVELCDKETPVYAYGETMRLGVTAKAHKIMMKISVRMEIATLDGRYIGTTLAENVCDVQPGEIEIALEFDLSQIVPGQYRTTMVLYQKDEYQVSRDLDGVVDAFTFEITDSDGKMSLFAWNTEKWGNVILNRMKLIKKC